MPQFFTRKCVGQTAEYKVVSEKVISIQNVCIKEDGSTTDINGFGTVKNAPNNSRLEIMFNKFWLKLFKVKGEYVIIKLDSGYDSVLVGSTDRKSLWVLSRTPSIDPDTLAEYLSFASTLGFNVNKLQRSNY
jgi:apolipoprotein D and lipocalin family protein